MDHMGRMRGNDSRNERVAIERISHSDRGTQSAQLGLLAPGSGERGDLVAGGHERADERTTDRSRSTSDEDVHESFLSRAMRSARPEPSASVTASSTAVMAK